MFDPMMSDILILLDDPVSESVAETVKAAIFAATKTATIHFKLNEDAHPAAGKIFLVKFDPEADTPADILAAVRDGGWRATMAGG